MFRKASLFFLLLAFTITTAHAQQKIAYIDAAKLLKKMPETASVEAQLDQFVTSWNQDAEQMQNDLTRKRADLERRKLIMTDAERTGLETDIQNLQRKLNDFRQEKYGPSGELFSQQSNLMKPTYDKLMKAIEEAAKDGNYDYVFDRSSKDVSMLYTNSKYDLTVTVAKKLGIETDLLQQPLINTPPKSVPQGGATLQK
jgi:outer membrane protein